MSEPKKPDEEFWRELYRNAAQSAAVSQAEANELLRIVMEVAQRMPEFDRGVLLSTIMDRLAAAREKVALDAWAKGIKFPLAPDLIDPTDQP